MIPKPAIRRFWKRVAHTVNPQDCWLWRGTIHSRGYGKMRVGENMVNTHRIAWILHYGELDDGERVRCCPRNKLCCNPAHLELIACNDVAPSRQRVQASGRCGRAKLSESQVRDVLRRIRAGETLAQVAREVGVNRGHLTRLRKRQCWAHVRID